jgi:hypothetical protein
MTTSLFFVMHARTRHFAKRSMHQRRQRYRAVKRSTAGFPHFLHREAVVAVPTPPFRGLAPATTRLMRRAFAAAAAASAGLAGLIRKI